MQQKRNKNQINISKQCQMVFQSGSTISAFPAAVRAASSGLHSHQCWVLSALFCFVLPFLIGVQDLIIALICNSLVTSNVDLFPHPSFPICWFSVQIIWHFKNCILFYCLIARVLCRFWTQCFIRHIFFKYFI